MMQSEDRLTEEDDVLLPTAADEEAQSPSPDGPVAGSRAVLMRLYVSHTLSTWNSRMFEFGAVLFLASIFPGTLLYTSIYALVRAMAAVALSSWLGTHVDRSDRLVALRQSIVWQRIPVAASCLCFLVLLVPADSKLTATLLLFTVVALLACVEKLAAAANTVAVERDWAIVISESTNVPRQELNASMRRIDLFCKLLAPVFISLIDGLSTRAAIWTVFGLNTASVGVEYLAIAQVYRSVPALERPPASPSFVEGATEQSPDRAPRNFANYLHEIAAPWREYVVSPVFLASFALSLLYLTVLSFGATMVTYLLHMGFTSLQVSGMRIGSVAAELSGTWTAPLVMNRIGPIRSGLWFLNWQLCCVAAGAAMFVFLDSNSRLVAGSLVTGVALSRIGLWGFDLSVQFLVQENVEEHARGRFSATEMALQNTFEMLSFATTIAFPLPRQFRYPVLVSFGAVAVAAACFAAYVRKERGHLMHRSKCLGGDKMRPLYRAVESGEGEEEMKYHHEDDVEIREFVSMVNQQHQTLLLRSSDHVPEPTIKPAGLTGPRARQCIHSRNHPPPLRGTRPASSGPRIIRIYGAHVVVNANSFLTTDAGNFDYDSGSATATATVCSIMEVPKARGTGRSGPRRRTGCMTCRARKVRCDETKPSCANCDRLRLRCVYKPPIALGGPYGASSSRSSSKPTVPAAPSISALGSPSAAAATAASAVATTATNTPRSPDPNFFSTVLRSDEHRHSIPAPTTPLRGLPNGSGAYSSDLGGSFDMLGFMGGVTTELEQKHLDLTNGLAAVSQSPQSLPASTAPNTQDGPFAGERRTPLSPDAPSSLVEGLSAGNTSDAATTRDGWSDAGAASYEDQLLHHFLAIDPPAAIFGPVTMEWKYVRPAILAHARAFSPLLHAVYCYSDIHKAALEGKRWRWAPTYYRAASSEIQTCLLGDLAELTLVKVFAAVFLLMWSELLSSPDLCAPGTSYLHTAYLLLQRFQGRTRSWTGLGHLLVSWVSLLDVKALIAGRDGDPLIKLGNAPEHEAAVHPPEIHSPPASLPPAPAEDRKEKDSNEDPFRTPSYLIYEAIVGPAFRFFVQAQQVVRRIVCIDLHHRSRGTLSDEFEVLQVAHKVGADLETLWHRRPPVIDVYERPEALTGTLCGSVALEVCRTFRQYVANFLANFIYLHRVAFAIYPRTDRVNGAVDQIIQLATAESAAGTTPAPSHLPISFLWPLFVAGLEGSAEQRQWIVHEMQRMAAARKTDSPAALTRHPAADKVLLLLEEMTRRQDASRTWADSRCVRRELFSDFFVMI